MTPRAATHADLCDAPRATIGPLPQFAPPSAFARALRRRLRAYDTSISGGRHADWRQWAHAFAALAAGGTAFVALLIAGTSTGWPVFLLLSALTGAAAFMLLVQIGHDAAHGSVSRHRRINDATVFLAFGILGVSGALWKDRHLRLHHALPNVPGTGIDADGSTVVRLAPDKPHRRYHRFQPLYAPVLFALGVILLAWIEDCAMFRRMRRERPRQFAGRRPLCAFAATKVIHAGLFIGVPIMFGGFGWLEVGVFYLVSTAVASLSFAVLVIGTHVSDHAAFPLPDKDGRLPHDWATLQLVTSIDWSPTSALAAAWTGGANAHTAHHLFPGHAHSHAPALADIVIEAAAEAGLEYRPVSFTEMVMGQVRHVAALARRP